MTVFWGCQRRKSHGGARRFAPSAHFKVLKR